MNNENKNLVQQKQAQVSSVPAAFSGTDIGLTYEMARVFHASGAIPKQLDTPEKAFIVMQAGKELGIGPAESLRSFCIVNGKTDLYGAAVPARLHRAGLRVNWIESTGEVAHAELVDIKTGTVIGSERYTIDDARKAGLYPAKADSPWFKYTKDMLRYKCMARLIRFNCAHVLGGFSIAEDNDDYASPHTEASSVPQQGFYGANPPKTRESQIEDATVSYDETIQTQEESPKTTVEEGPTAPPADEGQFVTRVKVMRTKLLEIGYREKAAQDQAIRALCNNSKGDSETLKAIETLEKVSEIRKRMLEMKQEEESFVSSLTKGKRTDFFQMLINPEEIDGYYTYLTE